LEDIEKYVSYAFCEIVMLKEVPHAPVL